MPSDENSMFSHVLKIHLGADLSSGKAISKPHTPKPFGLEEMCPWEMSIEGNLFSPRMNSPFSKTQLATLIQIPSNDGKIGNQTTSGFGDFTKFNGSIPINFHYMIQWCIDEINDSNPKYRVGACTVDSDAKAIYIARRSKRKSTAYILQATNLMKASPFVLFWKINFK